jgi:GIY-YIG catalytic domain
MSKTFIIYQIYNISLPDFLYIGSTENFTQRKYNHKLNCKKKINFKLYQIINDNGGWDCWEMNPLEKYVCDTKLQARIREQYWIEFKKSNLNSNNAFKDNKEYQKQYYIENKDKIKQQYREKKDLNKSIKLN